jgi:septum formation protein
MIDAEHPLLLGSASPRRREILASLEIPHRVLPAVIDETPRENEPPRTYLERMAEAKLAAVATRAAAVGAGAVLVADTSVLVDGQILGKPSSADHARAMLQALSGRSHRVATCFALSGPESPARVLHRQTVTTEVVFRHLNPSEIDAYADTGEGLDKAGAYAIQGIGAFAVERILGSYSNVVGLPACEVVLALRHQGLLGPFPVRRARA